MCKSCQICSNITYKTKTKKCKLRHTLTHITISPLNAFTTYHINQSNKHLLLFAASFIFAVTALLLEPPLCLLRCIPYHRNSSTITTAQPHVIHIACQLIRMKVARPHNPLLRCPHYDVAAVVAARRAMMIVFERSADNCCSALCWSLLSGGGELSSLC